ncbi:fatty acid desaturase [Thalassovita taeanensis]|uniref:Fatty acid desaturase n=1 Tax=Thalassovita taeanensis TaxID=657014 RepID=A0A1H9EP34_9RHOB|nr:fatty acid desaturase [Thalassovita taeanensis]SEQ27385.1 Fatty acid desaturase [Thalassovita taeanensis]
MFERGKGLVAELPTLALLGLVYLAWGVGTTVLVGWNLPLAMVVTGLAIVLHSSLCHEVIHGHPFRWRVVNEALVFPAVALCVPYLRFRDSHLAHHRDAILTDPYDDPESNYLDPMVWARLRPWMRAVLRANNTLLGRMVIGPLVGMMTFTAADMRAIWAGDRAVLRGWLWHIPALGGVVWWLGAVAVMPVWAYVAAAYGALGVLKIRTFLEHQAHERARGRTAIVEDRGPLAFLFLHNNLHVVHHMHPKVPWHRLPGLYFGNRERYLSRNDGYMYRSYAQVIGRYLWRAKDPVPHPLWRRR